MENVKSVLHKIIRDKSAIIIFTVGGVWIINKVTSSVKTYMKTKRMLEKWKDTPKDVVILHASGRGKTAPNTSPFVIKLETYLRMTNIPYELDFCYPWSSKGKTPWITINGEHIADSQIIIEYLGRKYNKIVGNHNEERRAVARAVRIMMDEHFYWGLGLWRYVYSEGRGFDEISGLSLKERKSYYKAGNKRVKTNAWIQGTGRHDKDVVVEMMLANLRALSTILGTNKFLLGSEPCEEDCSVFGFLCQVMWCAPGSPYSTAINEELLNLKDYCIRMKDTFWPDWEKCLFGASKTHIDEQK